ncbi:MAG: 4-alpha-glucanotransferase [Candidatus Gastranaerophilales bacterium]|nr:4-alpha-glucanotransferase [Candidatus Gastranaerophilales bacterium]
MRLENVVRFTSGNMGRNVAFGRAPKKGYEEKEYTHAIQDALDYLGVQNRALIIQGTSFPARQGEYDIETGTPFNADELVEFAKLHGFNAIQLGPNGKLNKGDTSPYTSSVFEKNPLFIDFNKLMTPNYASILSEKDLASVAKKTKANSKNYDRTDFKDAQKNTDKLIDIAYANFRSKVQQGDRSAIALAQEFDNFENRNSIWIDHYAVLNVLSEKHGTDYYPNWPQADQELIQDVKKGDRLAVDRYIQIQRDNADKIEKYKFSQFIIDKQTKADRMARGGFAYISDLEVGTSSLDEIVFKDVFLQGYKIGCPNGGPLDSPQLWGMAVLDPNKLFNPDGSLGPAGEFLKAKLVNGMAGAQGVRVDHAIGLVNPYIYKENSVHKIKKNGVEIPDVSKLQAGRMNNIGLDKNQSFERILSDIVLPTMKEMGVNPKEVIWEDLGKDETGTFNRVFRQRLGLPGISCTTWTKGVDAQRKRDNWAYVGCHDNKPGRKLIEDGDVDRSKGWRPAWEPNYLAEALRPDPWKEAERQALRQKIESSPKERWKAKVAELFNSTKHIQISFMDFFGINKTYNTPGTTGGDNWTLRLNPNFKDTYYKSLENDEWAISMPEVLATAVQAKFDEEVSRNGKPYWETKAQIDPLLGRLNHWSHVLREKESK